MDNKSNQKTLGSKPKPSPSSRSTPGRRRNWLELPPEITASIISRLGAIEILTTAEKVCKAWRAICKDPLMWRTIDMRNDGDLHDMTYDLEKMCCHAVDRSCGKLVEITIEFFGSDELLKYITDRYSIFFIFYFILLTFGLYINLCLMLAFVAFNLVKLGSVVAAIC